jgi:hypothetical protein
MVLKYGQRNNKGVFYNLRNIDLFQLKSVFAFKNNGFFFIKVNQFNTIFVSQPGVTVGLEGVNGEAFPTALADGDFGFAV